MSRIDGIIADLKEAIEDFSYEVKVNTGETKRPRKQGLNP
jgi:hypothetical protein